MVLSTEVVLTILPFLPVFFNCFTGSINKQALDEFHTTAFFPLLITTLAKYSKHVWSEDEQMPPFRQLRGCQCEF